MALINCPECNKKISDKAENCPHCDHGFLIKKPLICPECDTIIELNSKSCSVCGYPVLEAKMKKLIKRIFLIFLAISLVVVFIYPVYKNLKVERSNREIALSIAKSKYIDDNNTKSSVFDYSFLNTVDKVVDEISALHEKKGWIAKKVDDLIYYVEYSFVTREFNGLKTNKIAFEVNINTKRTTLINGFDALITKYKSLGFILEKDVLDHYIWKFK